MVEKYLLPETEEDEEEDPAGSFGLRVGLPASPVEEGPNLMAFLTQRSTSSSASASLSVV
jgi:hypothetical protein